MNLKRSNLTWLLLPALAIAVMAAIGGGATNGANTLTAEEKAAGWRLLWDGQTFTGWRGVKSPEFPAKDWLIHGGILTAHSRGAAEGEVGEDIITCEQYSDFELVADFKLTAGVNSGLKYFVRSNWDPVAGRRKESGFGLTIGYEFQLLDDARHPDAKLGRDGNRTLGALYDLIPPATNKPVHALGRWNTARIVARGGHVEHWLNGRKIIEFERGSPAFREAVAASKFNRLPDFASWSEGCLLLQDHGGEVSFRNLKIRPLAPPPAVSTDKVISQARRETPVAQIK